MQYLLKFLLNWHTVTCTHVLLAQPSHIINPDSGMEKFSLTTGKHGKSHGNRQG